MSNKFFANNKADWLKPDGDLSPLTLPTGCPPGSVTLSFLSLLRGLPPTKEAP